ncbi:hypothetical protein HanRHA438_Chr04g0181471 [Helianthus annuus]|nr:hypothetical protein HanRHA438_Chr04g0181471 [Helianthus annuus]
MKKLIFGVVVIRRAVGEEDRGASDAEHAVGKDLGTIFADVEVFCNALGTHYQCIGVLIHLCQLISGSLVFNIWIEFAITFRPSQFFDCFERLF